MGGGGGRFVVWTGCAAKAYPFLRIIWGDFSRSKAHFRNFQKTDPCLGIFCEKWPLQLSYTVLDFENVWHLPLQQPRPPPPPHSEVGMTACVLPKCPVKGYFSCDKVRPENCKKRGVFDFSPGDFFKKGVFFFFSLISLDS